MTESKNIRHILNKYVKEMNMTKSGVAEKSLNGCDRVREFLRGASGIYGHQLIRMMLALGFKITMPDGTVILGNNPQQEIRENFEDK